MVYIFKMCERHQNVVAGVIVAFCVKSEENDKNSKRNG